MHLSSHCRETHVFIYQVKKAEFISNIENKNTNSNTFIECLNQYHDQSPTVIRVVTKVILTDQLSEGQVLSIMSHCPPSQCHISGDALNMQVYAEEDPGEPEEDLPMNLALNNMVLQNYKYSNVLIKFYRKTLRHVL